MLRFPKENEGLKVKEFIEEVKSKGFIDPMQAYFAKGIAGYLRGCIDQGYVKGEDEIEEAFRKLLEQ